MNVSLVQVEVVLVPDPGALLEEGADLERPGRSHPGVVDVHAHVLGQIVDVRLKFEEILTSLILLQEIRNLLETIPASRNCIPSFVC